MIEIIHNKRRTSCSCLMIVRDSERTIQDCMDSLLKANCFDKFIIILDTRTRDRTPEILAWLQAINPKFQVSWYEWKTDEFDRARNQALKYADTKYGFWMDSDDVLLDIGGLYSLLINPLGAAYYFNIVIPTPFGYETGTKHLRLFPILPGVSWELPVHEQLAFSLRALGVPEIPTPYRILHLGYDTEERVTGKHQRYYTIMSKYLREHPEDSPQTRYIREQAGVSRTYLKAKGLLGV